MPESILTSNESINELIDRTNDMVAAIDCNYHYLFLNNSLAQALFKAIDIKFAVGDFVFNGAKDEYRIQLMHYFEMGFAGKSSTFEFNYWIGNDELITEVSISPIYKKDQSEIYAIGLIARDITVRVKARNELENANRNLKLANEVAKIGNWRFDLVSNTIYLSKENQQLLEMESISDFEVALKPDQFINDFVYEDDRNMFFKKIEQLASFEFASGNKIIFEYKLRGQIGNYKTIEITAVKHNESTVYGVSQDVSERRHFENEILKTKNQLQSIIENTNDSIWLVDTNGSLIMFNKAYKIVFEKLQVLVSNNQTIDNRFEKPNTLGPAHKWKERYKKVMLGEQLEFEEELELDGQIRYYEGTLNPVIEKNKVIGVAGISRDVTERRKAALEVNKRKQQLDSIIENTKDSIWLVDQKGVMILYNSSAKVTLKKLFNVNFQPNVTMEQRLGGKMPEEYIMLWRQRYQKSLEGNQYTFIERIDASEGTFFYEITLNPVIESDKLTGVSVYAHDITESKLREQQLAANNLLLNSVIESPTKTIIFSLDRNYCYTSFNSNHRQTMKSIWGCDIQRGANILSYIKAPADAAKAKINFDRALNGESFKILEEYGELPNRNYYEDAYNPIYDEKGHITGLTVFLFDVTQTKVTEIALRESENRLSYALDATGEGVWDWNIRTRDLYCNQSWLNLLQFNPNEYKGKIDNFLECLLEEDRGYISHEIFKCMRGEITKFDLEHKLITKQGQIIWVQNRGKIVELSEDEKPLRMVGSLINITARKKEEQEKAKLIEELTKRNQDLEQFTYIISHNLRAPVAKILGIVELIREEYNSESMKELVLDILSKESNELDDVIRDLNNIISIRNSEKLGIETINLNDIFSKAISPLKAEIRKLDLKIEPDFSHAPAVQGIKSYMQSLFYNLMSNAIKYKREDVPLQLVIKSSVQNNLVEIVFNDNGIGFDYERNRDKVFGLYKRFHNHIGGKGMGLYITKTQVELMGGNISVWSKPFEGTTFTIRFPVVIN